MMEKKEGGDERMEQGRKQGKMQGMLKKTGGEIGERRKRGNERQKRRVARERTNGGVRKDEKE